MQKPNRYWISVEGNPIYEVSLDEYRLIEQGARRSNARLSGMPQDRPFCYTGPDGRTQGWIQEEKPEAYRHVQQA